MEAWIPSYMGGKLTPHARRKKNRSVRTSRLEPGFCLWHDLGHDSKFFAGKDTGQIGSDVSGHRLLSFAQDNGQSAALTTASAPEAFSQFRRGRYGEEANVRQTFRPAQPDVVIVEIGRDDEAVRRRIAFVEYPGRRADAPALFDLLRQIVALCLAAFDD